MPGKRREEADAALQDSVVHELRWDPKLRASRIGVAVTDGAITLTGNVKTHAEKVAAVKAAERVRGVTAVADELEVKLSQPHERDDTEIAEAASRTLRWNSMVPSSVKAEVDRGHVVLTGAVKRPFERDAAYRAIRDLVGVRGISNEITVKPAVQEREIDRRIRDAFERNARLDAREIEITAANGTAHLAGRVHSLEEQRVAERAAAAAPGIAHVDNRLVVEP